MRGEGKGKRFGGEGVDFRKKRGLDLGVEKRVVVKLEAIGRVGRRRVVKR